MAKRISCEYNIDTACVEVRYDNGVTISIDCITVENTIPSNMYERSELDYLVYNQTLSVPIASRGGGDIFEFDIHEKHHGVNGIVAGMPGSGKTEMVQSWLLSLAVNYSPQDLSFVLIDFKGTGMIAPFRDIPHLAGAISNLDTNIDRNLQAIQSEVHRREAIIDKYSGNSVKNINDLNKAYAKGLVPERRCCGA